MDDRFKSQFVQSPILEELHALAQKRLNEECEAIRKACPVDSLESRFEAMRRKLDRKAVESSKPDELKNILYHTLPALESKHENL